jgi:predicted acyl esterase
VVTRGYVPLKDGTRLGYTLTLPKAEGHYPIVLQYDPYAAGAASDPTWNTSGYAMLGVNFRGTGCSQGVFNMTRADIWGADGGEVVDWAAKQAWSDGNIAMLGFSFTGTSQIATAAYAGPALKAIMPGNIFPDLYRDISYPGGVFNLLDPAWIIAGRQIVVGGSAITQGLSDPACDLNEVQALVPDDAQTLDTTLHPFRDSYWTRDPASMFSKVHVPVLGCVNWQDTTVFSRGFNEFRDDFNPQTTWAVGGDGAHTACPIARARRVRFLDHYLKGADNGWERTPHLLVVHEVDSSPGRDKVPDNAGGWQSSFATWADVSSAIKPLPLYLGAGGTLGLTPPAQAQPADSYLSVLPSVNVPGQYTLPGIPGSALTYTTPRLAHDAEFLGSGSADLWMSSTGNDTAVQVTISELRPDGQEEYVQNGWLQLSHRKLDAKGSSALLPLHTDLQADAQTLKPGVSVLARLEIQAFDHVFRAGSALRLTIDTPGLTLLPLPVPASNVVQHTPGMQSAIVLGSLPGARAHAPLPACAKVLNQPCRGAKGAVPAGTLDIPEPAAAPVPKSATLTLGRPKRTGAAGRTRALRVTVRARGGDVHRVQLVLRDAAGRLSGASTRFGVGGRSRSVVVRLVRSLRPGRYTLRATGRSVDGHTVASTRRVTIARPHG